MVFDDGDVGVERVEDSKIVSECILHGGGDTLVFPDPEVNGSDARTCHGRPVVCNFVVQEMRMMLDCL